MSGNAATTSAVPNGARSVGWAPFASRLAGVLKQLKEDQYLILSLKRKNHYIQFAGQGSFGTRVETTSNHYRGKRDQLDEPRLAQLTAIGWHAPTNNAANSTPEKDPDGSSNFFIDIPASKSFKRLADLAVRTLIEVLCAPHPGFLEYEGFDADDNMVDFPDLGLRRARRSSDGGGSALPELLLEALKQETGIVGLSFDKDGDVSIQYGGIVTFVRLVEDPHCARIYARLLDDVEETPRLLPRLNEMNADEQHLNFIFVGGAVFAVSDVLATPLVAEQVKHALRHFCETADGIRTLLEAEFGENAALFASMPSVRKH